MNAYLLVTWFVILPAAVAPKTDAERIQGTWDVFCMELQGKVQPKNTLIRVKVTFDGDRLLTRVGKRPDEPQGTFKLDSSQTPKAYDLTTVGGSIVHGIYELDGDTLKVCLSAPGEERPTAMKTTPDDDRTLIVYQREQAPKDR